LTRCGLPKLLLVRAFAYVLANFNYPTPLRTDIIPGLAAAPAGRPQNASTALTPRADGRPKRGAVLVLFATLLARRPNIITGCTPLSCRASLPLFGPLSADTNPLALFTCLPRRWQ
jgi:hypothetical protein